MGRWVGRWVGEMGGAMGGGDARLLLLWQYKTGTRHWTEHGHYATEMQTLSTRTHGGDGVHRALDAVLVEAVARPGARQPDAALAL